MAKKSFNKIQNQAKKNKIFNQNIYCHHLNNKKVNNLMYNIKIYYVCNVIR